jgi:uncharacterized membrane protein
MAIGGIMQKRHKAFATAVIAGAVCFVASLFVLPGFSIAIGANVMFATYLFLIWRHRKKLTPDYLRHAAAAEDAPPTAIFLVAGVVVAAAMVSLFLAFAAVDQVGIAQIVVGMVSVVLGWFGIHTLTALHYAYEYYEAPEEEGKGDIAGGLEFPGDEEPDGPAFIYFSYVIGMTAQVSDVQVTSNRMRRLVLVHGTLSFWFNTVILAATVNAVIAIAGG